jgi:hypothetical protein
VQLDGGGVGLGLSGLGFDRILCARGQKKRGGNCE